MTTKITASTSDISITKSNFSLLYKKNQSTTDILITNCLLYNSNITRLFDISITKKHTLTL